MLSYQDSNLDKQNQNLVCYHYTIGQSSHFRTPAVNAYRRPGFSECRCKVTNFFSIFQI